MTQHLRLLVIEDVEDDAVLVQLELRRAGLDVDMLRVQTATEMTAALMQPWDLIIADYSLPSFGAQEALALLHRSGLDIPFIIVSGTIDEERAVSALRAGAHDFVTKERLARLVPAVMRATAEHQMRETGRAAERASRDSEERVRAIVEAVMDGIVFVDRAGQVSYGNQRAEEILGLRRSDLATRVYDDPTWKVTAIDGGPFPSEQLPFARVMSTGRAVQDVDHAIEHPDGRKVLLSVSGAPFYGETGDLEGMVAVVRDITAREEAQSRIRFQASLLDAVGEAVMATDAAGRITYWNGAAERLYGWSAEEVAGRNVTDITPNDSSQQQAQEIMAQMRRGESWSGEFEVRRRNGTAFMAFVSNSPIRDEAGAVIGIVGTSSDISARLRLEAELRQSQKMEAIGRLAGGVAHDFNNILTSIAGFAAFLIDGLDEADPLREDALEIRAAGERAASLTRQLLAFSRKQVVQSRVFAVAPVIAELQNMLRRLIGEDVQLLVDCDPAAGSIDSDVGLLEQVVVNLVINAADALSAGGQISIGVSPVHILEPDDTLPEGDYVLLTVRDSGCGITEDVLPHIFEPFFTTKDSGNGTGLGLSTVHGIVTKAGGFIHVHSTPGVGTTFSVYLPRTSAMAVAPTPDHDYPVRPGGGTILLVEDDTAVRQIARRCLERNGYRVLEAAAPSEALATLAGAPDTDIDLLLTDVILPEMHGPMLAQQVRLQRPDIRVLLMSGYLPSDLVARVEEGLLSRDTAILGKPFTAASLISKVQEVLDAPLATTRVAGSAPT